MVWKKGSSDPTSSRLPFGRNDKLPSREAVRTNEPAAPGLVPNKNGLTNPARARSPPCPSVGRRVLLQDKLAAAQPMIGILLPQNYPVFAERTQVYGNACSATVQVGFSEMAPIV
jgi:hypothetical protein